MFSPPVEVPSSEVTPPTFGGSRRRATLRLARWSTTRRPCPQSLPQTYSTRTAASSPSPHRKATWNVGTRAAGTMPLFDVGWPRSSVSSNRTSWSTCSHFGLARNGSKVSFSRLPSEAGPGARLRRLLSSRRKQQRTCSSSAGRAAGPLSSDSTRRGQARSLASPSGTSLGQARQAC